MAAGEAGGGATGGGTRVGRQQPRQPKTKAQEDPSEPPLADAKIFAESAVERPIRGEQVVVHSGAASAISQRLKVRVDPTGIVVLNVFRTHLQGFVRLKVDERGWLVDLRPDLLGVQEVEQHHFVP